MPLQVVNGAMTACTFGMTPSTLMVLPIHRTMAGGMPAANIIDNVPIENIVPFGMCMSIANPEVASATAAALGVLTPMPCVPVVPAPWTPGAVTTLIDSMPALNEPCICMCMWAGVISITFPGQVTVDVT